jgi:hypothetical protein
VIETNRLTTSYGGHLVLLVKIQELVPDVDLQYYVNGFTLFLFGTERGEIAKIEFKQNSSMSV